MKKVGRYDVDLIVTLDGKNPGICVLKRNVYTKDGAFYVRQDGSFRKAVPNGKGSYEFTQNIRTLSLNS